MLPARCPCCCCDNNQSQVTPYNAPPPQAMVDRASQTSPPSIHLGQQNQYGIAIAPTGPTKRAWR